MSRPNKRKENFLISYKNIDNVYEKNVDLIKFSFKYFTFGDDYGESFEEWQKENILADLNNKLKSFSEKKKTELILDRTLELYENYPNDSKFKKPKVLDKVDLNWGRLRINGKQRVIGFFLPKYDFCDDNKVNYKTDTDVFYVVFLDKNHQFAPCTKKHT